MFSANAPPAGQTRGRACVGLVPVQRVGKLTCTWCGIKRDEPERHNAIGAVECPAGDGSFVDSVKLAEQDAARLAGLPKVSVFTPAPRERRR